MRRLPVLIAVLLAAPAFGAEVRRVVALIPSHTEIVAALGAQSQLVGLSDAEDKASFPRLPRAGALVPRWEILVELKPDLVLADASQARYAADFARFKIPVKFYQATHAKSVEEVMKLIEEVGADIGRAENARTLLAAMQKRLDALDRRRHALKGDPPRIFFEIWPKPLQAVGPVSLQGHLLTRAGFENVVPDTRNEMPLISAELVVETKPEVILHTGVAKTAAVAGRPGWGGVPAVANARVVKIDPDKYSRAGPRVLDAYEELLSLRETIRP